MKVYLDDVRSPSNLVFEELGDWVVVRNYDEFVEKVSEIGLDNIDLISLDHDLGDSAMKEWYNNVSKNFILDYNNITEKTGMDCVKWLVNQWLNGAAVPKVMVHSANAIGSANMMGYINNYKHISGLEQDCLRWVIPHTIQA